MYEKYSRPISVLSNFAQRENKAAILISYTSNEYTYITIFFFNRDTENSAEHGESVFIEKY